MESHSTEHGDSRRKRRRLSSVSAVRAGDSPSSPGELGSMRPGVGKGSSSFVGSGSGIYFLRTVQSAFARNRGRDSEVIDDELVPGEDDRLQTHNPAGCVWNSDEVMFLPSGQAQPSPNFDDLVRWSQSYFNNWHPPFPFLHAPTILGLLEKTSVHGIQSLAVVEAITIRSVLSISVADRRQMPRDDQTLIPANLVFNTIDDAISCLTPILMQPSTVAALQALVSIQVFLVSMLRLNAASRIGGLIVRITFHLGLHRCPSRYKQFSSADADMRRRLFWAIYSVERYLSQSLGLPLDLKDDDIDVCYPDDELHTGELGHGSSMESSHDPRLLLLPAFLARHGQIKGLILELRHKSVNTRTTDPDEVAHVDSEISKWWNEAQDLLDPHYMNDENANESYCHGYNNLLKEPHKLLLVVQKHESTILLNRPVITSGYNTSLFASAMQKCIGASKQIVSKVYQHLLDGMNEVGSRDGRIRNPLFWPGFTWCVWMSGLILLYAASEGHYSVSIAQREAERCVKILEALSLRGNFWPGSCASALKDLQKALADKTVNGTIEGQHTGSSPGVQCLPGPRDTTNMNTRQTPRPQYGDTRESTTHSNSTSSASHSVPRPDSHPFDSRQAPQLSQIPAQNDNSRPFTANSQQNGPDSFQQDRDSSMQRSATPDYNLWTGMNGSGYPIGDQFDGFDDLFQLMDVSYQLSEQMYEPADMARY